MTFSARDHIYLATILPLAPSAFAHLDHHNPQNETTPLGASSDEPVSAADQQLAVLRRIRSTALERLKQSAEELHNAKGVSACPIQIW